MKYAIVYEKSYKKYIPLLEKELARFDVRSDIKVLETPYRNKEVSSHAIIYIGAKPRKYFKRTNRVRCLCVQMPGTLKKSDMRFLKTNFQSVYATTPVQYGFLKENKIPVQYLGNPAVDLLRLLSSRISDSSEKDPVIAIHLGEKPERGLVRKISRLITSKENWIFQLVSDGEHALNALSMLENCSLLKQDAFSEIKKCNVVITSSIDSVIEALLLNVPQVIVPETRGFIFQKRKSVRDGIVKNDFAKEVRECDELIGEISKILSSHEYCASILHSYQKAREEIGMEPFFRRLGQQIVEEIEES